MASEIGYTTSALQYDHPIARYTQMENASFVRHLPVNTISGATTVNFTIPPCDDFIDLEESFMTLKVKIVKNDGQNLVAADEVAFCDNVPFSVFKSVLVFLNNAKVTPTAIYQTHCNYFTTRFGTGKSATKIHLQRLQGLTGEAAGKNDSKNAEATGWTLRKGWTSESKEIQFLTQIPSDFCRTCNSFLPPLQDLRFEFKLNDPEFALVSTDAYKFQITDMSLYMRQVPVDTSTSMAVFKQQVVHPLKLNFTTLEAQSFSIPARKQVEFIRGIFPYSMPQQVYMVLVETDRLNGVRTKDPFKFENGDVEKVILRHGGSPVMIESINTDFENKNVSEAYYFLCQAFDVGHNGRDINLTYEAFINGCTMWAFTLSPDMDGNSGAGLIQKPGNFEVDIYFKNGSENPALTALFMGKIGKTVEIGAENKTTLI